MGGQHHLVVARLVAAGVTHQHAGRRAANGLNGVAPADAAGEGLADRLHVRPRAAGHRAPLWAVHDLQQAVVLEKADQGRRGIVPRLAGRAGPDRAHLGQQVVLLEGSAIAAAVQQLAQRLRLQLQGGERRGRLAVEADQVHHHGPEPRLQRVAGLGQQGQRVGAAVFQGAVVQRYAEGHLGRLRGHAKVGEEGGQVGIGRLVVDDEAGVHGHGSGDAHGVHRVRMAAQARLGLIQRDLVGRVEKPRAGQAGDARSDDGDLQPGCVAGSGGRHRVAQVFATVAVSPSSYDAAQKWDAASSPGRPLS